MPVFGSWKRASPDAAYLSVRRLARSRYGSFCDSSCNSAATCDESTVAGALAAPILLLRVQSQIPGFVAGGAVGVFAR